VDPPADALPGSSSRGVANDPKAASSTRPFTRHFVRRYDESSWRSFRFENSFSFEHLFSLRIDAHRPSIIQQQYR
jgi:hypothetical protein